MGDSTRHEHINIKNDARTRRRAPAPRSRAEAPAPPRDYKATVLLWLGGGVDSFNVLVPQDCPQHDEYMAIRGFYDSLWVEPRAAAAVPYCRVGFDP